MHNSTWFDACLTSLFVSQKKVMFDQVAEFCNFVVPFQVKILFKGRYNFLRVEEYFQKFSCYQEVSLAVFEEVYLYRRSHNISPRSFFIL
jgi:hypothetical protein